MTKAEFLGRLRDSLNGLSPADINTSMEFYSEIIDDRMEEGLSEEILKQMEAVNVIFKENPDYITLGMSRQH